MFKIGSPEAMKSEPSLDEPQKKCGKHVGREIGQSSDGFVTLYRCEKCGFEYTDEN